MDNKNKHGKPLSDKNADVFDRDKFSKETEARFMSFIELLEMACVSFLEKRRKEKIV